MRAQMTGCGRWIFAALLVAAAASGCSHRRSPDLTRYVGTDVAFEKGEASWYGEPYHGRESSSGEIYDMYALTAAHRTLPFGTRVRVVNADNDAEVVVRINDRGPFVSGRIIDVSRRAAEALEMLGPGVVPVRLYLLEAGQVPASGQAFTVQAGSFRDRRYAESLVRALTAERFSARIEEAAIPQGTTYRVRVGRFATQEEAERVSRNVRGHPDVEDTLVVSAD
ncbi:MAG: septal ring lytic transglycosylase RlpA family protein [Candidatus Schekmanbacteria bacterium]|nr:septal ring lytic transglycosylase RlpA family protein [Candidatus Schekmanbacteria bacterium]